MKPLFFALLMVLASLLHAQDVVVYVTAYANGVSA